MAYHRWDLTIKMRDGSSHGVFWERAPKGEVADDFRELFNAWHKGQIVAYQGEDFAWAVNPDDIVSLSVSKVTD
jgi:hypothetical protein